MSATASSSKKAPKLMNPNRHAYAYLRIVYCLDSEQSKLKSEDRTKFQALSYLKGESRHQVFAGQFIFADKTTMSKEKAGLHYMKTATYMNAPVNMYKVLITQYLDQLVICFDDYPD